MNDRSTSIYDVQGVKKSYGNHTILNIRRLEFHRGTIYGIVGPIGSGKSTLFSILAGLKKPDEGIVKYDDAEFKTNWWGKLRSLSEIALANVDYISKGLKVADVVKSVDKNRLEKRVAKYFIHGSFSFLLNRKVNDLSPGELAWLNIVISLESDPRVLMIDDYGVFFDVTMEADFRKKLIRMNKNLGTTIILAASSDQNIKRIASVLIYLDNGHISKIRPGAGRGNFEKDRGRQPRQRRQRN